MSRSTAKEDSIFFTRPCRVGSLLEAVFTRRWYSSLNAVRDKSRYSVRRFQPLVDRFGIDMGDYLEQTYTSYDSFITRESTRQAPGRRRPSTLISVADSRLLAYSVTNDGRISVKHSSYTITELLRDPDLAATYNKGTCLVFRLATADYHHYCFADDGEDNSGVQRRRALHLVQPVSSKRYKALSENHREYSVIETTNFSTIVAVEVGALSLSARSIIIVASRRRGQEKGYFSLGGSTILLLLKPDIVTIDSDIMGYSRKQIETKVRLGEEGRRKSFCLRERAPRAGWGSSTTHAASCPTPGTSRHLSSPWARLRSEQGR